MLGPMFAYFAPEEVARALDHIEARRAQGMSLDAAVADAARIYRARTGDRRNPWLEAYLEKRWRDRHRARRLAPGLPPSAYSVPQWRPGPKRYEGEVSFRAFLWRLFNE